MCRCVFEFQIKPKETCNLISAPHALPQQNRNLDIIRHNDAFLKPQAIKMHTKHVVQK